MTIVQLSGIDAQPMKALLDLFGTVFREEAVYQKSQPSHAYLKALLSREDFIALVAKNDGEVVAGLCAYVLPKFEQERKEIYVYDLAVHSKYRRQGIATSLLNALRDVARAIGAYVIFIQADKDDLPAVRLYESLGDREEVFHFDIEP